MFDLVEPSASYARSAAGGPGRNRQAHGVIAKRQVVIAESRT
jgi:hypothetical protein